MAITERYVTQSAAGGGDGSSGSPWTFAEAVAAAVAGDRINVQSDAPYSIGATAFGAGTFTGPIIWRGYDAVIGDCDDLGRNADSTLNTTGMPVITITGLWTMAAYVTLQNLNITGGLSSALIGDTTVDGWNCISCRIENTANNASARVIEGDDSHSFVHCDFVCSGASHSVALLMDAECFFSMCRFEIASATTAISLQSTCVFSHCVFVKNGSLGGSGIVIDSVIALSSRPLINGCTFFNLTSAVKSTVAHTGGSLLLVKNHATDCTQFVENTTNITCYDIQNRTRDNTSPPSTVELVTVGAITTDTGGSSTDYANAASGDLHLITTSPGYNAGWDGADIGALQTDPPAGASTTVVRRF